MDCPDGRLKVNIGQIHNLGTINVAGRIQNQTIRWERLQIIRHEVTKWDYRAPLTKMMEIISRNGAQIKTDEQVFGSNTSCGETK